jgi:hypothetical protein
VLQNTRQATFCTIPHEQQTQPAGAKIMRFSAKASSSGLGNSWILNGTEENEENEGL